MNTQKNTGVSNFGVKGQKSPQEPFLSDTGNPENGDYLDWYNHLKEGEVIPLAKKKN